MRNGGERAALDAAHVAVYGAHEPRQAKGGGVLLADNTILTCAHVVNLALGHEDDAFRQQVPVCRGDLLPGVTVSFPRLPSPNGDGRLWRSSVTLERWQPARTVAGKAPHTGTRLPWAGDLALLRLAAPPPDGARPADWSHAHRDDDTHTKYGSAADTYFVRATVEDIDDSWLTLGPKSGTFGPGYSGCPVWCDKRGGRGSVVGIFVSTRDSRGFAIPARTIWESCAEYLPAPPQKTPLNESLLRVVEELLTDSTERHNCAKSLVHELDLPDGSLGERPSAVELTQAVTGRARGGVTLLAWIARCATAAEGRDQARRKAVPLYPDQVLSAGEYNTAVRLMADRAHSDLVAAVEHAIPDLPSDESRQARSIEDALALVEGKARNPNRLPAVVSMGEFLAAGLADPARRKIREWSEDIAKRFERKDQLHEVRGRAEDVWRARQPPVGCRVHVRLERHGDGMFAYDMRIRDSNGNVFPGVVSLEPRAQEVAEAELGRLVEHVRLVSDSPPAVEFFVAQDALNLPFDQWTLRSSDGPSTRLGEGYDVVLRCPELLGSGPDERAHRLGMLGMVQPRVYPHGDRRSPATLFREVERGRDVACVVACCGGQHGAAKAAAAIKAGAPAVLWHRAEHVQETGYHLETLAEGGDAAELRQRIRLQRRKAACSDDPGHPGRHLALALDDPDWDFPTSHAGAPAYRLTALTPTKR